MTTPPKHIQREIPDIPMWQTVAACAVLAGFCAMMAGLLVENFKAAIVGAGFLSVSAAALRLRRIVSLIFGTRETDGE